MQNFFKNITIFTLIFPLITKLETAEAAEKAEKSFLTIGVDKVSNINFPLATNICRFINRKRRQHGIRCDVQATGNDKTSLQYLENGELEAVIVSADTQDHAYNGTGPFKQAAASSGANKTLRSLIALTPEQFTLIARADGDINKLDDLKNKKINAGAPASHNKQITDTILKQKNWTKETFKLVAAITEEEQGPALCDKKINAAFFIGTPPNALITEAAFTCPVRIISLADSDIDKLVGENSPYIYTDIAPGLYPARNKEPVKTLGTQRILTVPDNTKSEKVKTILNIVFNNIDKIKQGSPRLKAYMTPENMAQFKNTVPLHPAATEFFQKNGLTAKP